MCTHDFRTDVMDTVEPCVLSGLLSPHQGFNGQVRQVIRGRVAAEMDNLKTMVRSTCHRG